MLNAFFSRVTNGAAMVNLRVDPSPPMKCRDIERLLLAEPDGGLTTTQHASLDQHVASCAVCQKLRLRIAGAMTAFRTDVAGVAVPDADQEWAALRARLHERRGIPAKKRPPVPVVWWGAPLAAAAALALAYFGMRPPIKTAEPVSPDSEIAQAEFVEAGDNSASTLVYVDKESGWLVVWAADNDGQSSG